MLVTLHMQVLKAREFMARLGTTSVMNFSTVGSIADLREGLSIDGSSLVDAMADL